MTSSTRNITLSILAVILIVLGLTSFYPNKQAVPIVTDIPVATTTPTQITQTGAYVPCLPLHDNFSTKQCIPGMKADTGSYYALDFNLMSTAKPDLKNGDRFTASGVFTPVEAISSDHMRGTVAQGIFSVTTLTVEKKPVVTKPPLGKCYVGGCSAQVCSDQEGVASNCMYRPEYACYKKSTCERQANGQCGWTPNAQLTACLASSTGPVAM